MGWYQPRSIEVPPARVYVAYLPAELHDGGPFMNTYHMSAERRKVIQSLGEIFNHEDPRAGYKQARKMGWRVVKAWVKVGV